MSEGWLYFEDGIGVVYITFELMVEVLPSPREDDDHSFTLDWYFRKDSFSARHLEE